MSASLLAVIAAVLLLAYFAIFVALHVRRTEYDLVRDAVSDYGVGPTAGLFRLAVIANSLGVLALTGALADGLGQGPFAAVDYMFLLLIPVTRLAMALFPTDLEGSRPTMTGRIHLVLAIASFTFVYLAIADLTGPLRSFTPDSLGIFLVVLRWTAAVALLGVVVTLLARPLRGIFGLAERIYLLSTNLWFLAVALWLAIH
ncbi:DUF998 domain-containing protein [Actinoplanes sp. L3-i22]|uniref:DUF998 domain-containing protein n=1 Tax=Actinoplanes sp. L3-i22 TaxID=2836373 RepID=UPI001C794532|nr:DUF998 domain-containing protein [Actinoplanes sp. L3-i22]BCY06993.1 membrane protein [Actinoplanes sp. L3-i22]